MRIVFTGRAEQNGRHIQRSQLVRDCNAVGWSVDGDVDWSTDLLVASRLDTSKTRRARELRIEIITYEVFFERLRERRVRANEEIARMSVSARQDAVVEAAVRSALEDPVGTRGLPNHAGLPQAIRDRIMRVSPIPERQIQASASLGNPQPAFTEPPKAPTSSNPITRRRRAFGE